MIAVNLQLIKSKLCASQDTPDDLKVQLSQLNGVLLHPQEEANNNQNKLSEKNADAGIAPAFQTPHFDDMARLGLLRNQLEQLKV